MRGALGAAALLALLAAPAAAADPAPPSPVLDRVEPQASPVLDRVRAAGAVSCAAEERPGFAEVEEESPGPPHGLAADLCRAVAVAVLGPEGKAGFTLLDSDRHFDEARAGRFDVLFLPGGTLVAERLADRLVPGPPAFVETESVMVPEASPVRAVRDLAGASVCFMIGTGAQRALEAALEAERVDVKRLGFGEDVELRDAYNVGRCTAVAGEGTFLAEVRRDGGVHGLASRLLDRPLALDPVFLLTGTADGRWSALASYVLQAELLGSAPRSGWTGAGAGPLAAAAAPLGLRPGWADEVARAVGTYSALYEKDLGAASDLELPPGPNQPWPAGVMLPPATP